MCHTLPRIGYKIPYTKDIKVNAKHSQVLRDTFNLDSILIKDHENFKTWWKAEWNTWSNA